MPTATVAPTAAPAPIVVHVAGAVVHPGVYTLPAGQSAWWRRWRRPGGLAENADADRINLADHVRDGQQVYVPAPGHACAAAANPAGGHNASARGQSASHGDSRR